MFDHPRHYRVVNGDVLADPRFKTQLDCSEESTDQAYPDFSTVVGGKKNHEPNIAVKSISCNTEFDIGVYVALIDEGKK